jgi:hypothetical protein
MCGQGGAAPITRPSGTSAQPGRPTPANRLDLQVAEGKGFVVREPRSLRHLQHATRQTTAERGRSRNKAQQVGPPVPPPTTPLLPGSPCQPSPPKGVPCIPAGNEPEAPTPRHALKRLAEPYRFRVVLDAEGWPAIPGRYGRLEYHDGIALAVYSNRRRIFDRLWAGPGVRRWQVGDQEMRGLMPVAALPTVPSLIRARRRRVLTPEAARKRSSLPTVRVTSAR